MKPGDIVEALEKSPYAVTTPGTKWIIYKTEVNGEATPVLLVGKVPESLSQFKQNLNTYFKESYSSRRQRVQDNFRVYTVEAHLFKVVGSMQSNRQLAKELLSQEDDIWEQKIEVIDITDDLTNAIRSYAPRFLSNADLPIPRRMEPDIDIDFDESDLPW